MSAEGEHGKLGLLLGEDGNALVRFEDREVGLERMRRLLDCGGYIDCVRLANGIDMWVDDEGLFTREVNVAATLLARAFGLTHQLYHGPALICGECDGESVGLTVEQIRLLAAKIPDLPMRADVVDGSGL